MTAAIRAPQRIQLRRTKGWRKPEGAVSVARPTRWGNPFRVVREPGLGWSLRGVPESAGEWTGIGRGLAIVYAVGLYRTWLLDRRLPYDVSDVVEHLAGRDLACWCPVGVPHMPFWSETQPCHADVLLAVSNGWES